MKSAYFCLGATLFLLSCADQAEPPKKSDDATPIYCGPRLSDIDFYSSDQVPPLFDGLEGWSRKVNTTSEKAQQYFDQGLMLSYGFNHAEAARSFWQATKEDSSCAMCYWGLAYVLGPNYNAGMEADNYERAWTFIETARMLANGGDEKETDMIAAMHKRYVKEAVDDRSQYDQAYSDAMAKLAAKYPDDADIAAIYAESLMDLHPWDLWEKDGTIKEWTPNILAALERAIELAPEHPGANHFYIHATEASRTPEMAMGSADLLTNLVPGSGHLVHMPSHTYIRTGRYYDGMLANIHAAEVDSAYTTACHAAGIYPLAYYPHNVHFLAACAALAGNKEHAIAASWEVSEQANKDLIAEEGWGILQHFYSIPWFTMVKFAAWDEILANPPDTTLTYPHAIWHYSAGMAEWGNGKMDAANGHLAELQALSQDESLKEILIFGVNSVQQIAQIAAFVLEGELLATEGKTDEALEALGEARRLEFELQYQEPPDWFFSVRHHIASVQLEAERWADAEATLLEDLAEYPETCWALAGLHTALEQQGKFDEALAVKVRMDEATKHADIEVVAPRLDQGVASNDPS